VEKIEKQIKNAPSEAREALKDRLRKAKAEKRSHEKYAGRQQRMRGEILNHYREVLPCRF